MKSGKRIIYWDATCWLAWLYDERAIWPADVITGLEDVVYEIEANNTILLRSAIMRSEVIVTRLTVDQEALYRKLLRRPNFQEKDADPRVMDRAGEIREYHRLKGQSISTPDAIHLATAIIYKVDEFHTMDGLQKGGSKKRKLLSLSGDVGGYNLKIVHPYPRRTPPAELVIVRGPLFPEEQKK
jgi:predicted nucleic acid-binding protein